MLVFDCVASVLTNLLSVLQAGVMAYRNQFFIGVITGVLVTMVILGIFQHSNRQSGIGPIAVSKGLLMSYETL